MSKNFENKKKLVDEVVSLLDKDSPSTVVVDYTNISSNEMNDLRNKLFENDASLKIVKNTFIERVLNTVGIDIAEQKANLTGQNALLIAKEDILTPIKDLYAFLKETKKGEVKFGVLKGNLLESAKVKEISNLPSREELLGKVVGSLISPIRNFAFALNDTQSKFVRVLSAIKDSKQE